MIPMTSPTYRVVTMRETTQKTVEMLYEGELVRLAIDLTPMGRTSSGLYATDCRLEKQMSDGSWVRCSDYLSTNNMMKKLCIVPKGIDPTPYAQSKRGPVLTLVEA